MIKTFHIRTFLYVLAFIWFLLLLLEGYVVTWEFLKLLNLGITIAILLLGVFEKWIWKWKIFHPWFVDIPNLIGTWKGNIASDWINSETKKVLAPINAFIAIRQTYSSIHLQLITQESCSDLINGELIKLNNIFQLAGLYMNKPKAILRHKSEIHFGGLLLQIHLNSKVVLDGQYWTDRKTRGDIYFNEHIKKICTKYEECESIFQNLNTKN